MRNRDVTADKAVVAEAFQEILGLPRLDRPADSSSTGVAISSGAAMPFQDGAALAVP